MNYNYYFEIIAIVILIIVLYDYNGKTKMHMLEARPDAKAFIALLYVSLLECVVNLTSSLLIAYTSVVPRFLNIFVATLFFVLQATQIYVLALFSFIYMKSHFSTKSLSFVAVTVTYGINVLFALISPFVKFYFYFDEHNQYVQGFGSDVGYFFYIINILFCLAYVLINRKHLLMNDMRVAAWVAILIGCGVFIQYRFRSILAIDATVALAILYLYMTLENPNDYRDKLTHCANEYGFNTSLNRKCEQKKVFSVLCVDLKKFRYVNSLYGTQMGDFVLQKVALFLKELFPKEMVFRVHNDLFAVTISCSQDQLEPMDQQICARFREPWVLPDGQNIMLESVCIVCEYPTYFQSHTELVKLRTSMLTKIKDSQDKFVLYSDKEFANKCQREEKVENILRVALQKGELEVHYQPIVDGNSNEVVSLEALSRLRDDDLGFIPPDEFIAVAEATGQIITLGFYVMDEVCKFIKEVLVSNPQNTVQNVHVNLSALQCVYPELEEQFQNIIEKYHVPCSMIHFELTESVMLESPQMVRDTMDDLNAKGMFFSLDDYGTGYSNISYLIQFPFEKIKFDKNLVWSYFEKKEAKIIMQKEFDILHTLHKEIILEGIETQKQYQEMKEKGIHLFQGYYFSKPLPKKECIAYLRGQN